jgi:uncharacterized protein (DUF885 family)
MKNKKRTWKFWAITITFTLLFIAGIWITNLVWFKPFNIKHFYERAFIELVLSSPETTTFLGIPFFYDLSKDELDDISDEALRENFNKIKEDYQTLLSYDFENQSDENKLNTKILKHFYEIGFYQGIGLEGEPFLYHDYPVNQMFGVQSGLPSMMASSHKLEDESDIEAYITRLNLFDTKFSQLLEGLRVRESKGIIPPKFINDIVIREMEGFVGFNNNNLTETFTSREEAVKANILYSNFETKIKEIESISEQEKENYLKQVAEATDQIVFPAYISLIDYMKELDKKATNEAGVWKLPNGDEYYRFMLKVNTTTDLDPEEIFNLGLSEVNRIEKEINAILIAEGYADSSKKIGQIIQALNTEDRFTYSDNDQGREMIIDDYIEILAEMKPVLKKAFNVFPKAELGVKRVPVFKEEGSPFAYYEQPAMDGSKGGMFFINLRKPKDNVKFGMKTLAYHEGIPGHHFQIAIANELQNMPTFRSVLPFTAYVEGWALYAERLAWELGIYENDPYGNLGRLQAEMFRAVRLVVDAGMHYKRWTREKAIDYMISYTGMPTDDVISEINRYTVYPGQACAYKVGMMKILELREKAKRELGSAFDLKEFHSAVLENGAVPLDILEEIIEDYIAASSQGVQ